MQNITSARNAVKIFSVLGILALVLTMMTATRSEAATSGFSAAVTNAASAPTNSTSAYTITLSCRVEGGCGGSSVTVERPVLPDGTKLYGPANFSLKSGENPGILFSTTDRNADQVTINFSKFDLNISQVFTVSWATTDAFVIPGTYAMNWQASFPPQNFTTSGQATGVVTGTPGTSLQKTVVDGASPTYAGAFRTYQLFLARPKSTGTTGVTATLVDQLPPEVEFKGFTETGLGADNWFRRLNGTTLNAQSIFTTTEDGTNIYEYNPATHQVIIHLTRGVDSYIAARNNGRAMVRYKVQVKSEVNGTPIPDKKPIVNTFRADNPVTLDGKAFPMAPSSTTVAYSLNRAGTYFKGRTQGEYLTTPHDRAGTPDLGLNWRISANNPGTAPAQLRVVDTAAWSTPITGEDYRYVTSISLQPVRYNGGALVSYPATVVGTSASGEKKTYNVRTDETLVIPAADQIVSFEVVVDNFRNVDPIPDTETNGNLDILVTTNVRITTPQIAGATKSDAIRMVNTANIYLADRRVNTSTAFYTIFGKLPYPQDGLGYFYGGAGDNLGRAQKFNIEMRMFVPKESGVSNPEAFLVTPRGFTLGDVPTLVDIPGRTCAAQASDWQFEKMADYNGAERWRITLKDGKVLDPQVSTEPVCYRLEASSGNALAGAYDQANLSDPNHGFQLYIREMGGALSHAFQRGTDDFDINSDGKLGGQWSIARLAASVAATSSVGVSKTSIGDIDVENGTGPTTWIPGVEEGTALARETANFEITASTTGTTAVDDMVVYDMLPNARNTGDNWQSLVDGVTVNRSASTFSPDLSGPVTSVGHNKNVTVYYSTATNPCRPELSFDAEYPDGCTSFNQNGEWTTDLGSLNLVDVTAVRIQFNEKVFGDFAFNIPMSMPETGIDGQPLDDQDSAINRAAIAGKTSTGAAIPFVGPTYARVKPFGGVGVNKSVVIRDIPMDQAKGDAPPVLRADEEFIWVVESHAERDAVAVADPSIIDVLPSGVELVEVLNAGGRDTDGTYDSATGEWRPGRLDPGTSKFLYLKVKATGAGDVLNQAFYDDPNATDPVDPAQCSWVAETDGQTRCDQSIVHIDAGDAEIHGNVFQDLDWSDTDSAGDQPYAGWRVNLTEVLPDGSFRRVAETITGEDGSYSFLSLPAADYRVAFEQRDAFRYGEPHQGGDDTLDSDPTVLQDVEGIPRHLTDQFALAEDRVINDIDFGVQPLATVSGRVFDDRDGNGVRDSLDPGMADISVTLLNEDGSPALVGYNPTNGDATGQNTTTTDAEGKYNFAGLRPGTYRVQVGTADDYTFTVKKGDDANIFAADLSDVTATGDDAGKTAEFGVEPGSNPNVDAGLQKLANIGGVVWQDNNGDGYNNGTNFREGVTVELLNEAGDVVATTTTNSEGKYAFLGVVPGNYVVHVVANGATFTRQPENTRGDTEDGSDVDPKTGLTRLMVMTPGYSLMHFDAGILPESTVSGSIFYDDNDNGVWDTDEPYKQRPLIVELFRVGETEPVATTTTVRDGEQAGTYSFTGITPGDYYIQLTNPYAGRFGTQLTDEDITVARHSDFDYRGTSPTFAVNSGNDYPNIDAGILRNQQVSGNLFNDINGNGLWDENEPPREGVTVTLTDARGQEFTRVTDASGFYAFDAVMVGMTTVAVTKPEGAEFTTQTGDISSLDGLRAERRSDVAEDSGAVTFTVVGYLNPDDPSQADVPHIDAGLITPVAVSGIAFDDRDRDGARTDGDKLLPGVTVTLFRDNADGTSTQVGEPVQTSADGTYTFADVRPGTYHVLFIAPNGTKFTSYDAATDIADSGPNDAAQSGNTTSFTVAGAPVTNVDAGLITGANVSGMSWDDTNDDGVRDPDEQPRPAMPMALLNADGTLAAPVILTKADGTYEFVNVPAGTYTVAVGNRPMDPAELEAELGVLPSKNTATGDITAPNLNDFDRITWETSEFSVNVGQDTDNVDIGVVPKEGISGLVFEDTNRNGSYDIGEPLRGGVEVTIHREDGETATVVTGDSGLWFYKASVGHEYWVTVPPLDGAAYSPSTDWNREISIPLFSDINAQGETKRFRLESGQQVDDVDAGYIVSGSISGTAFRDANNNGLHDADASERVLPGVTVTLFKDNGDGTSTQVGRPVATDANGGYTFNGVTPGDYRVEFSYETSYEDLIYTTSDQSSAESIQEPGISDVNAQGSTAVFKLAAAQDITNVDAGMLRTYSISGLAFEDAYKNGTFAAADGDARLPGVNATLQKLVNNAWVDQSTAQTDAQGAYNFAELLPGTYRVVFDSPAEGAQATTKQTGEDPAKDSDINPSSTGADATFATDSIVLDSVAMDDDRAITHIDAGFVLNADISGRVWIDTNNNGFWDSSEQPLTGLVVKIYLDESGTLAGETTTGADGGYEFLARRPGEYSVRFEAQDGYVFSPHSGSPNITEPRLSDVNDNGATDPFTLTAGKNVPNVDAGYVPVTSISGRAFIDQNYDGLAAGDPPREVTVNLLDDNGQVIATTTTDPVTGAYTFNNVVTGHYTVAFQTFDGEAFSPPGMDSDADAQGHVSVQVRQGIPVGGVNAGYIQTTVIAGHAFFDSNGDGDYGDAANPQLVPAAGIAVELLDADGNSLSEPLIQTTGEDGSYRFTTQPGTYRVKFVSPQQQVITEYVERSTPITDPYLNDIHPEGANQGMTEPFTVQAGDIAENIDGGFRRLGSLSGTVFADTDFDGLKVGEAGMSGVTVELLDSNGAVIQTVTTDSSGEYQFAGLQAGEYTVRVVGAAGQVFSGGDSKFDANSEYRATVGIAENLTNIDAGYRSTSMISGIAFRDSNNNGLRDAGEEPVGGLLVQLEDANGNVATDIAPVRTNALGEYAFTVAPGGYHVHFVVESTDNFTFSTTVASDVDAADANDAQADGRVGDYLEVRAGERRDHIDAGVIGVGSISGNAFDDPQRTGVQADGLPVGGVLVRLFKGTEEVGTGVYTDEDGNYTFEGVVPGEYTVRFETRDGRAFTAATADSVVDENGVAAVKVGVGQNVTDVDAGYYPVAPETTDPTETTEPTTPTDSTDPSTPTEPTDTTGPTTPTETTDTTTPTEPTEPTDTTEPTTPTEPTEPTEPTTPTDPPVDPVIIPGAITGTVFQENGNFGNIDSDEPGIGGVTVRLLDETGAVVATTVTESNGGYRFENLTAGTYTVEIVRTGGPLDDTYTLVSDPSGMTGAGASDSFVVTLTSTTAEDGTETVEGASSVNFGWEREVETTDPTEPTDPTTPTDTTTPTEPTTPTDPKTPTEPTDPTTPTDPTEPSDPTDTTVPTNPTEPTDPTDTATPTDPTGTSVPTDPTGSTGPADPSDPATPEIPTGSVDVNPGKADPTPQPQPTPSTGNMIPGAGTNSLNPSQSSKGSGGQLAMTGANIGGILIAGTILLGLGAVLLIARHRRDNDGEEA